MRQPARLENSVNLLLIKLAHALLIAHPAGLQLPLDDVVDVLAVFHL